jgi:hypothetical protein
MMDSAFYYALRHLNVDGNISRKHGTSLVHLSFVYNSFFDNLTGS